jgi:UDP-N-acetylmuramoyl-tripeptide--D-alanyl-D-alanine ligase
MKTLYLSEIAQAINISLNKALDCPIKYVSNDITRMGNDTIVFHLNKAVEFNDEKFNSYRNCFIVTDQPLLKTMNVYDSQIFYVLDVHAAYNRFINYYRNLFKIPIVAVTGTCGKTTTKEMIAQILRNKYKVAATIRSRNALRFNHDYLLSIDDTTDFGVFETGITHPGNLITGCAFFKPTIGIITTIGIDHLNGCKTMNNYIRTKGEMFAGLQYGGNLIINNDDENIKKLDFTHYYGKITTFGIKNDSTFKARNIKYHDDYMSFTLTYNNYDYEVIVPGYGEHNVYNALAALAALTILGMNLNESIGYLAKFKHIRSHVEFHKGINNSIIIDDTWSSNPTSTQAAINVLKIKGEGKTKIAVLGKINYLGKFAKPSCRLIAKMLVDAKVDHLITQDEWAKQIGVRAVKEGMNPNHVIHCTSKGEVKSTIEKLLTPSSIALFKISMLDQSLASVMRELIVE